MAVCGLNEALPLPCDASSTFSVDNYKGQVTQINKICTYKILKSFHRQQLVLHCLSFLKIKVQNRL